MSGDGDFLSFSAMYLRPDSPMPDSKRFRIRASGLFDEMKIGNIDIASFMRFAGGIEVPLGAMGFRYDEFFKSASLRDLLDSIGLIYRCIQINQRGALAERWKTAISHALKAEALSYRLTEECTVRYLVDEEFERNNLATIDVLGRSELTNARRFFESAVQALGQTPPDTRKGLREVYEACEEAYKIVLAMPAGSRLNTRNAVDVFRPPTSPQAVATAVDQMGGGFASWVTACQQYRHAAGDPTPEAAAPPLGLAVLMFSQGAGYLRWIAGLVPTSG